jgi:hypothetical protein
VYALEYPTTQTYELAPAHIKLHAVADFFLKVSLAVQRNFAAGGTNKKRTKNRRAPKAQSKIKINLNLMKIQAYKIKPVKPTSLTMCVSKIPTPGVWKSDWIKALRFFHYWLKVFAVSLL